MEDFVETHVQAVCDSLIARVGRVCIFCAFCFPGEHVDLESSGQPGAADRSARRGCEHRAFYPGAWPRRERLLVGHASFTVEVPV